MSPYTYRPAQARDLDGLTAMLARSFAVQLASDYPSEVVAASAPAFTRVDPRLLGCGTWFVALAPSGEVVGCGGWTREQPGSGEVVDGLGHLRHFCTDINHLRRGIGAEIAALTTNSARAAGIARLDCVATLSAESFYRSLGLHTVERMTVSVPVSSRPDESVEFPALLMRLELSI